MDYWVVLIAPLIAQLGKNLPAMQEIWARFLGGEDPPEKEMALQYSCLGNPMNIEAWWATVCGVAKSQTRLSNLHMHT